ncbi:MAG: hypothetical protein KZQ70_03310 [gamma proteobacterium symbiont of Lucinoma myriamae]|nr:hypothetical protein [gamma proteobacterium symbiont of Lucinoma myriamae]MCU7818643.1 hypothetical protein [gamma proteobacterium symbiont of Lucinoma myriamae]MCU7831674.1 hypothetical protein [gamma proteobacterium symbiont of Lucinoma myriamae]
MNLRNYFHCLYNALAIISITLIFVPTTSFSGPEVQRITNQRALQAFSLEKSNEFELSHQKALNKAKIHDWPIRQELPNGKIRELIKLAPTECLYIMKLLILMLQIQSPLMKYGREELQV